MVSSALKRPQKILMLHNKYLIAGGEDVSTRNEAQLLRDGGHEVDLVEYDNDEIEKIGSIRTAIRTTWSLPAIRDVKDRLEQKAYDILHVQNYFPLISPAVLRVGAAKGVTTIQALRNYRLLCANAQLFRNGKDCEKCLGNFVPWAGIKHGCYRNSRLGSGAIAAMIATHKLLGTWQRDTHAFIAVSDYVQQKYIKGGFQAEQVFSKPNVVAKSTRATVARKQQIAYVGRLSPEKGIETLISAWKLAHRPGKLVIVGDGPSKKNLMKQNQHEAAIQFLGHVSPNEAKTIMAQSQAIVIPSLWAEPFPRTGVEAFSVATPVFGARSGGIPELFHNNQGGALFTPGSEKELSQLIIKLFTNPQYAKELHIQAAEIFSSRYTPGAILKRTEEIYAQAIERKLLAKRS